MVGTRIQELTRVIAASAKCAPRSVPVTCRIVASGSTMATRLNAAAIVTTIRMMGAVSSSSMYFVQICSALKRVIQKKISARNSVTPQFQHTSARLKVDHCAGSRKNTAQPTATEIHSRGCSNRSFFMRPVRHPSRTPRSALLGFFRAQPLHELDQLVVAACRFGMQPVLAVHDDGRRTVDAIRHEQGLRGAHLHVHRERFGGREEFVDGHSGLLVVELCRVLDGRQPALYSALGGGGDCQFAARP